MIEAVRSTLLVAGLVFPGIAAYTAVYVTLAAMVLMLAKVRRKHLRSPVAYGIFAALAAVLLSVLLNGAAGEDWTALLLVLPFALALPTAAALAATPPRVLAALCLIGSLCALTIGLVDIFAYNANRAGGGNNPIHYASLAGMLGMVSLTGAVGSRDRRRFVFLLGPVAAFATAMLSGSRGPLMADCVMLAVALVIFWPDRRFFVALVAFPVAGGLVVAFTGEGQRALILFMGVLSERTQSSDMQRVMMYSAALEMFTSSPLWGHGFAEFMDTARTLHPIRDYDNLHSDLANFASVAGVLGLVAYVGLVGGPLLALASPAARRDRSMVLLVLLVTSGNATMGLTNAIIGVLPQTTLFVLMLGYVLARERALAARAGTP